MSIVRLDGILFRKMLENGLNNLKLHEEEINRLNVFPVADGDTGTNMRLTLEHGLRDAASVPEIGRYLCSLSNGMLVGARGNSGVILSQLFKGLYLELPRAATVSAADLRNGFIRAYRVAYKSVMRPVEGTLLTVAREGIENVRTQIGRSTAVETMLSMYLGEMRKSLAATPEMLGVLKSAGVVDSGGAGYVCIIDGMLKYLYGETVSADTEKAAPEAESHIDSSFSLFNENSAFTDGYCTEFLLQLMAQPGYLQNFSLADFGENLNLYGDSLVTVIDGTRVKVHIHTKTPEKVISYARQYGEFITFKLENMQIQHNERTAVSLTPAERKTVSTVIVADGEGMREMFLSLGCDAVIDGGMTMNPPASDFLKAFGQIYAENIVVFPNNKNTYAVALQAKELYSGDAEITVLKSTGMLEAYFALALDVGDGDDAAYRIAGMREAAESSRTLEIAAAQKDWSLDGISVSGGEYLCFSGGKIVCGGKTALETLINGLKAALDAEPADGVLVSVGADISETEAGDTEKAVSDAFPELEINVINGGQHIYGYLAGLC